MTGDENSVVGKKGAVGHVSNMKLEIDVPGVTEEAAAREPEQGKKILVELACMLFQKGLLSFGRARELAGMKILEFQTALYDRQIPRVTLEAFEEEMQHARH